MKWEETSCPPSAGKEVSLLWEKEGKVWEKIKKWIAISIYALVAIIKKRLNIQHSLYTVLQVLSITAFEKVPLIELLTEPEQINKAVPGKTQLTFLD